MQINPLEKSSLVQTRIFPPKPTIFSLEKNDDFLNTHNEGFLILSYCFAISLFMYIVLKNLYYLHIFKRTRIKIIESLNNDDNVENEIEEMKRVKNLIMEQVIHELMRKSIISKRRTRKDIETDFSHNVRKEDMNLKENEIEMTQIETLKHLIHNNLLTEFHDTKEKNFEYFIKFLQQLMILEKNEKEFSNNILVKDLMDYIINIGKKEIQKSNTQLSQNYSQNYIPSNENDIYIFKIQIIKELLKNNIIITHSNDGKQLDDETITKILEESLMSQANIVEYFYIEMIKKILGNDYNELNNISYTHDDLYLQKYEKELIKKKLSQYAYKNMNTKQNNKYEQDKTVNKHIHKNQIEQNQNTTNLIEKEEKSEKNNKFDNNRMIQNNISVQNETNDEFIKNIIQHKEEILKNHEKVNKNEEIENINQHKKEECNYNDKKKVKEHSKKPRKNFKRKCMKKRDIRHLYQIDKLQDKILKNLMGQDSIESDPKNKDKQQLEEQKSDIQNEKLNTSNEQEETRKTNSEHKQNEVNIDQNNMKLNIYNLNNQDIQNHYDKNVKEKLEEENILSNNIIKQEGSMASEGSYSSYESIYPDGSIGSEGSYSSYESIYPDGSIAAEGSYSSYDSIYPNGSMDAEGSYSSYDSINPEESVTPEGNNSTCETIKEEDNMTSQNNYSSNGSYNSEEYKDNMDKIKMYDEIIQNGLIDRINKPRTFEEKIEKCRHYSILKNKENRTYLSNWNNEKIDIKEFQNKSEEELEQWKNKQWEDWKVYLEEQWSVWLEISENDKIEWLEDKEREFRGYVKDIYDSWFKWLKKMKSELSGEQKPWMTWNEQEWQTFFETRYNKQFLDEWDVTLRYMDKILNIRKFTLWNKWKGKKLTQWLMQDWKLIEDDEWEKWEEDKSWLKRFNMKKKNEWKKWRNRIFKEYIEWKEWIYYKGQSANVLDLSYWEEWKEDKRNELKEWLDALTKQWILQGKWKELVKNQE
ncbi:tryptophan-rich antigen 3 [Plasmodium reichenowi]|uniref:Tryptophan-rich antigen 3 n=1 Tax=Plasmodium reichenowi TaxID=5854 RepID=A0A2P9DEZ0_PLARE|nr:tryptophan-rich antigen 3 [Plasmodium reichenowi]